MPVISNTIGTILGIALVGLVLSRATDAATIMQNASSSIASLLKAASFR